MPEIREMQTVTKADVGVINAADLKTKQTGIVQLQTGKDLLASITKNELAESHKNLAENVNQVPYIINASTNSPSWPSQQAAKCEDGDFAIVRNGNVERLMPLKYWLLQSEGFMTNINKQGIMVECYRDMSIQKPNVGEHYVSVLIVETPMGLVPARGEFRTTKAPVVRSAVEKIKQSQDVNWPKLGDAEKIASQYQVVFGRTKHEATIITRTSRSGPMAGNPYKLAVVSSHPATVDELTKLDAAFKDAEFMKKLETVCDSYLQKVSQLNAMIK